MEADDDRQRLFELLVELSYERREIVLSSGRRSDFYIDCRNTSLHPEGIVRCGRELLRLLRAVGPSFDGVAGPSLGADPLVSGVLYASWLGGAGPVPGMLVRKEAKGHGTGRLLEGTRNIPEGGRVAIVEDVLTTGGSALRTISAVRAGGYEPVRVVALVDRDEGASERIVQETGLPVSALYRRSDFTSGALRAPTAEWEG